MGQWPDVNDIYAYRPDHLAVLRAWQPTGQGTTILQWFAVEYEPHVGGLAETWTLVYQFFLNNRHEAMDYFRANVEPARL